MIAMIVGQCHVGDSHRRVIRYLIGRLRGGYRGWVAMPKAERKAVMSECIRVHEENRGVYRFVMSGHDGRRAILHGAATREK